MITISKYQAERIKKEGRSKISLDLGISEDFVEVVNGKIVFPDKQEISFDDVKKIIKNDTSVFLIKENQIHKVQVFSEETNKFYKLMPTGYRTPPTIEISGIRMHVTKEMNPLQDTIEKIKCIAPVKGNVLDCNMGLGYTAIKAAEKAVNVVTCEIDPNVLELAKHNPWSKKLFDSKNIEIRQGDSFDIVKTFKGNYFSRIVHDPPSFKLAVHLYSEEFYKDLFHILLPGGILYHYTGNPGSKKRGMDIAASSKEKLLKVGFRKVVDAHRGLIAIK